MSVDISHIIKHDFRKVHDREASMKFVKETIETLKRNLLLNNPEEEFEIYYEEEYNETRFCLPIYDVEFTLHNGFWHIESFCNYYQIVMHSGDYFGLRRLTYDIAHALGQKEAWYAEEYYTWNGNGCEEPETTFEQWYERAVERYGGPIPEFNQSAIIAEGDVVIPKCEPIYHDSFEECNTLYDSLQLKFADYRLLGLYRTGTEFLRFEQDGKLRLIQETI